MSLLAFSRRTSMRRAFSLLMLFLFPIVAGAQDQEPPQGAPRPAAKARLKIGVALEGGGALGLAHIGVLQWFEEQHVPVDFIAGTSMGGLVGGFYATGLSPKEMKNLIESLDWDAILRDRTPYEGLWFLRKQDQRAYPDSLVLGLRKGLHLPAAHNSGNQIGRSEEHTSELQSPDHLVCRLLLAKKKSAR